MPPTWRDDVHSLLSRSELTLAELVTLTGEDAKTLRDYLKLHNDFFGRWTSCENGFPISRYFLKETP